MLGVYINLKDRIDRKTHFESNIKSNPFFSNIVRMDGILHENRVIGCAMSHLCALQKFEHTNDAYIAIFEDDFFILDSNNFNDFIQ